MYALPRNMGAKALLQWCSRLCLLGGAILLALCAYICGDAYLYQMLQGRRFKVAVPSVTQGGLTQCRSAETSLGSSIGRLEIPRIGLSVVVLEGDDGHTLLRGAGHIPGTAWPCQNGNVAIAAHRDTYFRALRNIRQNDVIRVITFEGSYLYRVESTQIVSPSRTEVLDSTGEPTLTLVTCYPFFYVGPAPKRFIVRARQIPSNSRTDFAANSLTVAAGG